MSVQDTSSSREPDELANGPRMWISADMLAALTDDKDSFGATHVKGDQWSAPKGNIAASVYRATQGGGLSGINLGWKDMEASTAFLCGLVSSIGEAWDEVKEYSNNDPNDFERMWESLSGNGSDHEIADGAVPCYTRELLDAAVQLGATSVDDEALLGEENVVSMERIAQVALYELAFSIVHGLVQILIENAAEDES